MPGENDGSSSNLFVRFKHHVDTRIGAGLQGIFGLPSLVTQNFKIPGPDTESTPPAQNDAMSSSNTSPRGQGGNGPWDSSSGALARLPSGPVRPSPDAEASSDSRVEAVLEFLSGGTFDETDFAWKLFASRSQYSPLMLEKNLPTGPRPQDVPADIAAKASWTDAFEDLLTVSSGQPMRDSCQLERNLRTSALRRPWDVVYEQAALADGVLGSLGMSSRDLGPFASHLFPRRLGDDVQAALWAARFSHRPLGEAYFPAHDPKFGYTSPRTMEEWVERRRRNDEQQRATLEKLRGMREFPFGLETSREWVDQRMPPPTAEESKVLQSMLLDARAMLGSLMKDRPPTTERSRSAGLPVGHGSESQTGTEQDVYTASSGPQDDASVSKAEPFFKWPRVSADWSMQTSSSKKVEGTVTTREVQRDVTGKTVKTTEEFTTDDGNVVVKTTIQKTDAHGHEVQNESYCDTYSPRGEWLSRSQSQSSGHTQTWQKREGTNNDGKRDGSGGWFW